MQRTSRKLDESAVLTECLRSFGLAHAIGHLASDRVAHRGHVGVACDTCTNPRRGALSSVLALNPLSASDLLSSFGTIGILVVLFAETGLLIGFFLPGDSLLFTAGLLSATGSGASISACRGSSPRPLPAR